MRQARRHTAIAAIALSLLAAPAAAQLGDPLGTQPIVVPNTSSSFNQQGFNLPSAPRATGQDIVRGAGGISCQSAIGSGGPSLDMGVIGTNDIFDRDSTALYGRVTIPLGKRPKRVDCTRLYELEVSRLQMELEMMRTAQAVNERSQAVPVIYEDASPPPSFTLGAIPDADIGLAPVEAQAPDGAEDMDARAGAGGFTLVTQAEPRTPPRDIVAERPTPEPVAVARTASPSVPATPQQRRGGCAVQLAAYADMESAREGRDTFADRLGLVGGEDIVVVPKTVKGKDFFTVRVVGLSRQDVAPLCAAVDGNCLRL